MNKLNFYLHGQCWFDNNSDNGWCSSDRSAYHYCYDPDRISDYISFTLIKK